MATVSWHASTILMTLVLVSGLSGNNFESDYDTFIVDPYNLADEQIPPMYAYRGEVGSPLVIETNALINTKYRTWKRNADIINSLLALPKGMNDAGR